MKTLERRGAVTFFAARPLWHVSILVPLIAVTATIAMAVAVVAAGTPFPSFGDFGPQGLGALVAFTYLLDRALTRTRVRCDGAHVTVDVRGIFRRRTFTAPIERFQLLEIRTDPEEVESGHFLEVSVDGRPVRILPGYSRAELLVARTALGRLLEGARSA